MAQTTADLYAQLAISYPSLIKSVTGLMQASLLSYMKTSSLNVTNATILHRNFADVLAICPHASSIYFGWEGNGAVVGQLTDELQLEQFWTARNNGSLLQGLTYKYREPLKTSVLVLENGDSLKHLQYTCEPQYQSATGYCGAPHGGTNGVIIADGGVYDPRSRPWYKAAQGLAAGSIVETVPYTFTGWTASHGAIGATVASPIRDSATNELIGVLAIDIKLSAASHILASIAHQTISFQASSENNPTYDNRASNVELRIVENSGALVASSNTAVTITRSYQVGSTVMNQTDRVDITSQTSAPKILAAASAMKTTYSQGFIAAANAEHSDMAKNPLEATAVVGTVSQECTEGTASSDGNCLAVLIFIKRAIYFDYIESTAGKSFLELAFGFAFLVAIDRLVGNTDVLSGKLAARMAALKAARIETSETASSPSKGNEAQAVRASQEEMPASQPADIIVGDIIETQRGPGNPYAKGCTPQDLLVVLKEKVKLLVARWEAEGVVEEELVVRRRELALEYMSLTGIGADMFHVVSIDALWGENSLLARMCRIVQSQAQCRIMGIMIGIFLLSEYMQQDYSWIAVSLDLACLVYITIISGLKRLFSITGLGFYWVRGFIFDDVVLVLVWVACSLSFMTRDYDTWELSARYHFVGYFRALLLLSNNPRCLVAGELFVDSIVRAKTVFGLLAVIVTLSASTSMLLYYGDFDPDRNQVTSF